MRIALALVAVLAAGCESAPVTLEQAVAPRAQSADARYALVVDEAQPVSFRGSLTLDAAGLNRAGGMLYGPGAVGFVAGLIVHGTILASSRSGQKSEMQAKADKVLVPYAQVLAQLRQKDLVDAALASPNARVIRPAPGAHTERRIESTPVYSMTQDQAALVLDDVISIVEPGSSDPVYTNDITIVSTAITDADPVSYWNANDGAHLRAESARMFRESLELAFRDAAKGARSGDGQQKTVRYHEGRIEQMERAEVLESSCDRALIRNLRGWLMSVPLIEPTGACVVEVAR